MDVLSMRFSDLLGIPVGKTAPGNIDVFYSISLKRQPTL